MGQLNTYVSWHERNILIAGDNPPVGILLCTRKDHALVADMDNRLFISKCQLELPSREEVQRFVEDPDQGAHLIFQMLARGTAITVIIREFSISPKSVSYRARICKSHARDYRLRDFPSDRAGYGP